MRLVKWTPKAEQDLDGIREYIAKNFGVGRAIDVINTLVDFVESTLAENPLSGKLVETNPFFAKLIYKKNTVYYCENPKDSCLYVVYVQVRKSSAEPARLQKDFVFLQEPVRE